MKFSPQISAYKLYKSSPYGTFQSENKKENYNTQIYFNLVYHSLNLNKLIRIYNETFVLIYFKNNYHSIIIQGIYVVGVFIETNHF